MSERSEQQQLSREHALERTGRTVVLAVECKTPTPIVLIDGRSGAGKTHFARKLADTLWRELEQAPRIVHMDDLYPGWDGLREGSLYLLRNIIQPISRGETANWQHWNWARGVRGKTADATNGWREFSGGTPLIVEGCGSLSRETAKLAELSLWIHADSNSRRQRWISRDGDRFGEHWHRWAAQEDDFYEAERSERLAQYWFDNSALAIGEPGSNSSDD